MSDDANNEKLDLGKLILAFVVATALGAAAGWLMTLLPSDSAPIWLGLALIPLWFLLELFFEAAAAILGAPSKASRFTAIAGLLLGFYVAWFSVKGIAP